MPISIIDEFKIRRLQVLDEFGTADEELMPPFDGNEVKKIFERIILARTFNQRALSLQREGRLGTYASILGQEASQVGSAIAFEKSDWIFPSFRETGVLLTLGYPAWQLFRYWSGDERGMSAPDSLNIFPMSVPVGSQIPHATGTAMAMKIRGAKSASAVYFGDGASSRGDFHEALNLAGVFKAPAVFLCQNNQWAISVPRHLQTAAKTIAQRAFGYGIEGIQVDGNDVFAVYSATKNALNRAKSGLGATLIECFTYRLDDHTTSDDSSRYRSAEEVEEWKKKEPLIRLRLFMKKKGLWTQAYEDSATGNALNEIDKAISQAESYPPPDKADIIRFTNAEMTLRQKKELKALGWEK